MKNKQNVSENNNIISRKKHDLTTQQREAIFFGEGPLMVVAGAGTGKTFCITQRVANLISSGAANTNEILVLTFSEKAAQEMEERIDIILPYAFSDIWVSTFHSFGQRILRDHSFDAGLDPDFKVLTEEECIVFLEENIFKLPLKKFRPLSNPAKFLEALVRLFSRLKDEDISAEEYKTWAASLPQSDDPVEIERREINQELASVYEAYNSLMFEKGFIDLADLIYLPLQILRNHPLTADRYRKKYKFVLVDEFQDTNFSQYQLLKNLAMGRRNLTVVGDDDQSIYKFRGAAISNILNFMDDFPEAHQVTLTKNFRSPQKILDAAYKLISHNNPDRLEVKNNLNKKLEGRDDETAVIFHKIFDNIESQSEYIAGLFTKKAEEGVSYADMAVLIRNNRDAESIIREFNLRDIPFRFSGNSGLYLRPEIRILISFFRLIADPDDSLSLYFLSGSEVYGLNPATLTRLSVLADHSKKPLLEIFRSAGDEDRKFYLRETDAALISRIVSDYSKYNDLALELTSGRLLYEFLRGTGYLAKLAQREVPHPELKTWNISIFFDIIKRFEGVSDHPYALPFIRHLNNLMRAGDDPAPAQAEVETDAVSVMTVHKAKGLEFPVVALANLAEGNFPTQERRDTFEIPDEIIKERGVSTEFHIQEERRLFYVAMTRAKQELYLFGVRNLGGKRTRKISRFIQEALDVAFKSISVKTTSPEEAIERFSTPEEAKKHVDFSTAGISELTHYQIDDYLTCPLKYKYVHILRVPVLQHHNVVYGKAVRSTALEIIRRKAAGIPTAEHDILEGLKREWSVEGFLSREHEEARFREGQRSLKEFYHNFTGKIIEDDLIDKKFRFYCDDVKITGSWDLLKTDGEGTIIWDFRSSEVKNLETAIRKTKDSLKNQISILAYREIYNTLPVKLISHYIGSDIQGFIKPTDKTVQKAKDRIEQAIGGIASGEYGAKPEYYQCLSCAYMEICPATAKEL
ncbi:MAG: ATP-dependent helicase [Firmicutes bacterium]|nr:ATP-dependent helicase [Bacillota bacterium]